MSSNSNKASKRQHPVSKNKEVEVDNCRVTEEEEGEYEKEESVSVTSHLSIKPIDNCRKLDKEVILRRIRHRKRVNRVRAAVGAIFGSANNTTSSDSVQVQQKKWVDDAFAAL